MENAQPQSLMGRAWLDLLGIKDDLQALRQRKTWMSLLKYLSIVFLSCLVISTAVNLFIIPAHLGKSGFAGIGVLLKYMFKIDVGTFIGLVNIPLILIGFPFLGRRFIFHSIVGVGFFTLTLKLTKNILVVFPQLLIHDKLLCAIYGGVLLGIGLGYVLRIGGNTGGVDIVALVLRYFTGIKLGYTILVFDGLVITGALLVIGLTDVLYTLIEIFIYTTIIRLIAEGGNVSRTIVVISRYAKTITAAVHQEMSRGVTVLSGRGAYTGDAKEILYIVVPPRELNRVKEIVDAADPEAFMIVQQASNVFGRGFTRERSYATEALATEQRKMAQ